MKNLCLLVFACILFASCKKEKPKPYEAPIQGTTNNNPDSLYIGLPGGRLQVNGYFYACISRSATGNMYMNAFAAFSKLRKNLTVNYNKYTETNIVDTTNIRRDLSDAYGGDVKFNKGYMNFLDRRPQTYIMVLTGEFNMKPTWSSSGAEKFDPFITEIKRGFPVIKTPAQTFSLNANSNFVIPLDSLAGYDSLTIQIRGNLTYRQIEKRVPSSAKEAVFNTTELQALKDDPDGLIIIKTYNYSYKSAGTTLYLFELANKCAFNYTYSP